MHRSQASKQVIKLLPNIGNISSKGLLKTKESINFKENVQSENNSIHKQIILHSHNILAKKPNHKSRHFVDQMYGLKISDQLKQFPQTRRKLSKPWVPKNIDTNKQTAKGDKLKELLQKQKFEHSNQCINKKDANQKLTFQGLTIKKQVILKNDCSQTLRMTKAKSEKNGPLVRQKISSCKVAMRKGIFPLNKKHYNQIKLIEHFEKDDVISTIHKRQDSETDERFISMQSYVNLVL